MRQAVLEALRTARLVLPEVVAPDCTGARTASGNPLVVAVAEASDMDGETASLVRDAASVVVVVRNQLLEQAARVFPSAVVLAWPCEGDHIARALRRGGGLDSGRPPMPDWIVGSSDRFRQELGMAARFAEFDVTVLIEGETGTGKDMMARAVHYYSARADRPFVPVNCGAIPDHLFESEMFGHVAGAFTDAKQAAPGLVGLAEGGTLFLDEISRLSPHGQVALLRFLQDGTYRPVGAGPQRLGNVRIVAATNEPLKTRVQNGAFREDLYFRLNTAVVELAPLRERPEDVAPLARHFARQAVAAFGCREKRLLPEYAMRLAALSWPGNVRELKSTVERAVLLADGDVIGAEAAAPPSRVAAASSFATEKARVIGAFEKDYLRGLMARSHGNVTRAAAEAGKERKTFDRLLRKHGITREEFLPGPGGAPAPR